MEQYNAMIKMLEDRHRRERRNLTQELRIVKTDMRTLKITTRKMRTSIEARMRIEDNLREELQAVKDASSELKRHYDTDLKKHESEKRNLKKRNNELRNSLRALKKITTTTKKSWEMEVKRERETHKLEREVLMTQIKDVQNELQSAKKSFEEQLKGEGRKHHSDLKFYMREKRQLKKELEALKVANNKLKMESESKMGFQEEDKKQLRTQNEELQRELEAMKVANYKLQKQFDCKVNMHEAEKKILITRNQDLQQELKALKVASYELQKQFETRIKVHEEEKKVLLTMNQGLQQELEGIKTRVSTKNLQLVSRRPEAQDKMETSGRNGQPKFSLENFHPVKILGEGGFGKVLLAKKRSSDGSEKSFAVKIVKKSFVVSRSCVSFTIVEKEALILTAGHPFITTLYSCFQTKEHLFFVMEYVNGGDMVHELQKVKVFSEKRTQFYAAEITLALEFLHRQGILHRDLKLENVLIDSDGHCKVADFGLAQLGLFQGHTSNVMCGTPSYMAPELLQQLPYGHGVDWWALGVIMYAMLTGRLPFHDANRNSLRHKIIYVEVVYPEWISEEAQLIMRKLLQKNPLQRLGTHSQVENVRRQPFFRGVDWLGLMKKRVEPPHKPNIVQEREEYLSFDNLLKPDNTTFRINEEEFEGFSYVNHGVQH